MKCPCLNLAPRVASSYCTSSREKVASNLVFFGDDFVRKPSERGETPSPFSRGQTFLRLWMFSLFLVFTMVDKKFDNEHLEASRTSSLQGSPSERCEEDSSLP